MRALLKGLLPLPLLMAAAGAQGSSSASVGVSTAVVSVKPSSTVAAAPTYRPTGGYPPADMTTLDIKVYPRARVVNGSSCSASQAPSTQRVSYYTLGGLAVIDGDIVFGSEADIVAAAVGGNRSDSRRSLDERAMSIPPTAGGTWPKGEVLFAYAAGLSAASIAKFKAGTKMWTDRLPFLKFTEVPPGGGVLTVSETAGDISWATIGYTPGAVVLIGLSSADSYAGHAVGHVLGLHHEHSRHDRDFYVNIDCNQIREIKTCVGNGALWTGWANSYRRLDDPFWDFAGPYDVNSIMHFNALQLAAGTTPVITGKPGITFKPAGRDEPTLSDARHVCELYWEDCHAVCGDGVYSPPYEKCDDGNNRGGDDCSANCQEVGPAPSCLKTCTPAALPPGPDACEWGAGAATCQIFDPIGGAPHAGQAFCFCQAGFRASGVDPKDTTRQFHMTWFNGMSQSHRVAVQPGQKCNQVCDDNLCSEVPFRDECR